ncbi:hypothetical protein Dester_0392 [Desulfurobacterium thermolithotrophum DSM 11699]|uniref:YbbR family protein n=1 Tax=Desulfurobacterium thermolithotrophum (strain DSM 11699 / BSA) TaxID=868864 RepID=F0S2H5_DESTD|nr:hypothetical protein [Desulfurobacterium thermolithotrophum]ADY73047.1 hypothetical protein Dester_0392 [Desulfurobacterium thermolithotrophum DSM 11699]
MKKAFDLIFYKFHYKVLALLSAILLWLLATNKEITETELRVKVSPLSRGNYKIIDYFPKEINLTVEGYRKDLLILKEKNLVRILLPEKIQTNESGTALVKIKKDKLLLPVSSVKVKKIDPSYLRIKAEKLIKKVVPVKLEAIGIRKNLKLILSPNYVIVYIPEKLKNKVHFVRTEKIDLSSIKGNAEIYLNIVSNYKVEPSRVKLIIRKNRR